MRAARVRHGVLARRSTRQKWLVGVSPPAAALCLERRNRSAMVEDASGTRFASRSSQEPAPRRVQQQAAILGAAKSGPSACGRGFGKQRPKGAHAAPQRAPSDARDHAAARGVAAVRTGARQGCPRPSRSRGRDIFDHGTRPLSTACVTGCSPHPPTTITRPIVAQQRAWRRRARHRRT
jgi:hypothetical protein